MKWMLLVFFCLSTSLELHARKVIRHNNVRRYSEVLLDVNTYEVLHQRNMNLRIPPASLTKLMTLFALFYDVNNSRIRLTDRVPFSKKAVNLKPSKLNVRQGESVFVREAIYALITKSANDVACAVAEKIGGNEENFARLMNYHAKNLHMHSTHFANASGLHNKKQYSTAHDMCKLAIALMKIFPEDFHYFSKKGFFHKGNYHKNHNKLLGFSNYEFLVDGMKTGFVNASGYNIVASATKGGKRLLVVVLGANSAKERDNRVSELFKFGFSNVKYASHRKKTMLVSYRNIAKNYKSNSRKFCKMNLPKDSILNLLNASEKDL